MNMYDIITKKKTGQDLTTEEIDFFVQGFTDGTIPDYQASALLMAICLKMMDNRETADLTRSMMNSGDVLDLQNIPGLKVDKHSTGGVGDKTTLVLAPMLAACGLTVAKMSGRALGHTGGTIDKLESIPGFNTSLSEEEFFKNIREHNIVVAGQTKDIAPADKKLYALRDVTATVDNMSLIASSIMSKKLASGADAIVLDVKTGSGSFAGSYANALDLAHKMVSIGKNMNKKICAVISDMNQPLGCAVGNALEVKEAIETLKGGGPRDLIELCITLGSALLCIADSCEDQTEAEDLLKDSLASGSAYAKFKEFVAAQGGDIRTIDNTDLLPQAEHAIEVVSEHSGYVSSIQCEQVGMASLVSGAGREVKDAPVDPGSGLIVYKKIGDKVTKGEPLAVIYSSDEDKLTEAAKRLEKAYTITAEAVNPPTLIYDIIN